VWFFDPGDAAGFQLYRVSGVASVFANLAWWVLMSAGTLTNVISWWCFSNWWNFGGASAAPFHQLV
jgi:hypothetical protein